jgi:hypothetical protein
MARNLAIQILRTTRANLNTQGTADNLNVGELYLVTDESVVAVGLTTSTYVDVGGSSLVKAIGTDLDTGTDDAKYVTSKALTDSRYMQFEVADTEPADETVIWLKPVVA